MREIGLFVEEKTTIMILLFRGNERFVALMLCFFGVDVVEVASI